MVRFYGWPLSEAACFGLGSGLAFYFKPPTLELPLGLFMGRCRNLEENFLNHCHIPYQKIQFETYEKLRSYVRGKIKAGEPVLLQGDIAGLPYYKSPIHFPGHKFVVCGMVGDDYVVADTSFADLQRITESDLDKTTSYENSAWAGTRVVFEVARLYELAEESAITMLVMALDQQIAELSTAEEAYFLTWEKAYESWRMHTNFGAVLAHSFLQLGARGFYQVLEKRGTGGGAFRGLYLDFVRELRDDRLFPFSIHRRLFKNRVGEAQKIITDLAESIQKSFNTLRDIATMYKQLSFKKSDGIAVERKVRNYLHDLWQDENGILGGLKLLRSKCVLLN